MKYDIIIIGGGLSGLVAGVRLVSAGRRVAIITSGQSALHFSSGSMSLLNTVDGKAVVNPVDAIGQLPDSHPYRKIGAERVSALADEAARLLERAGLRMEGSAEKCRYRLTPLGLWEPTWLSLEGLASCDDPSACPWRKVAIVNFHGYLDFFPDYIADGFSRMGIPSVCHEVRLPQLAGLRGSCSEMRAASIAKLLCGSTLVALAGEINKVAGDADVILLPAVVGLQSDAEVRQLASLVDRPVRYVPVIPMSVVGVRAEFTLRRYFENLGGTYLLGDSVRKGNFESDCLRSISTAHLGDTDLSADQFVLATGSFFSRGLVATPDSVVEPVFGLDVDQGSGRADRCDRDFFSGQPYMRYGVAADSDFRVSIVGRTVSNLRAIGAILSGADPLTEGSGAGIAILTALDVANRILSIKP